MTLEPDSPSHQRRVVTDLSAAIVMTLAGLTALVGTSRDFGMVWDEGHTIRRERTLAAWFHWIWSPPAWRSRTDAFSQGVLSRHWPFSRQEPDGHPPFYAILGLAGWWLARDHLEPLSAYRFGPMALCSVTVGMVYFHLARRRGRIAAMTAALLLLFMPRLFAHAHYAHYDMPMSNLWILAQIAFCNSLRSFRWVWAFGALVGLAAGTKFTGWFAPGAAIMWIAVFEWFPWLRRWWRNDHDTPQETPGWPGTRAVVYGLGIAVLVLYLIQPPWWFSPFEGVRGFIASNLTRSETKPIPSMYLGNIYEFSLPWHNTLVITAITVPAFVLALGMTGIVGVVARCRATHEPVIWLFSWLTLIAVRMLPLAPGHDVERQFLPSFLSLAVLAGYGADWLATLLRPYALQGIAVALSFCGVLESLTGIVQLYPYTLSYYNIAVGGLRGADRRGFEPTYYWDGMGPEFLRWVREKLQHERVELRFPSDLINIRFLREWGDLPTQVLIVGLENTQQPYYVMQRRRGLYYPYDWWLERHGQPCFTISRQGVDLLRVFPFQESYRAYNATKGVPTPQHLRH